MKSCWNIIILFKVKKKLNLIIRKSRLSYDLLVQYNGSNIYPRLCTKSLWSFCDCQRCHPGEGILQSAEYTRAPAASTDYSRVAIDLLVWTIKHVPFHCRLSNVRPPLGPNLLAVSENNRILISVTFFLVAFTGLGPSAFDLPAKYANHSAVRTMQTLF